MKAKAVRAGGQIDLTPALDPQSRLAHGALLQASVRARVLGVPLLRLEATVALVPARLTAETPPRASTRSRVASPQSGGLAEAVRSINEGAELLADVRRNGS